MFSSPEDCFFEWNYFFTLQFFIMPFPWEAAIGAAGSAFGGVANAISTGRQNFKSREFSREMYQRQKQDAFDFWNVQNAYNSPEAQMQRFKEAGLNPNLIYGQGNSGNAGSIPVPDVQSAQFRTPEWGNAIKDAGLTYMNGILDTEIKQAQIDILKGQREVIDQDLLLKALNAEGRIADTERTRVGTERDIFNLDFERSLRDVSADARREEVRQRRINTDLAINRDAREAVMNTTSVQEAAQRMLSMRESRAKSRDERAQIRQATANLVQDGIIKDMEIGLRKQGINPNDPMWARIVSKMLSDYFDTGADPRSKGIWNFLFR